MKYRISFDKMKNSPNPYIKEDKEEKRLIYGADAGGSGISQLFMDYKRGFHVFGNRKQKTKKRSFLSDNVDFASEDDLELFLKNYISSPKNFKRLEMYSQGCALLVGSITATFPRNESMHRFNLSANSELTERTIGLELKIEGTKHRNDMEVIYQRVRLERYPVISTLNGKIIGSIEGPVEALFKLTDKGFEFQYMETESELIKDLFLKELADEEYYFRVIKDLINNHIKADKSRNHSDLQLYDSVYEFMQEHVFKVLKGELEYLKTCETFTSTFYNKKLIENCLQFVQKEWVIALDNLLKAHKDPKECYKSFMKKNNEIIDDEIIARMNDNEIIATLNDKILAAMKGSICEHFTNLSRRITPDLSKSDFSWKQRIKRILTNIAAFFSSDRKAVLKQEEHHYKVIKTMFFQSSNQVKETLPDKISTLRRKK